MKGLLPGDRSGKCLARPCGYSARYSRKSTAFNICGALAGGQLLRQVRDGFQLGRGLLKLGSAYASSVNLVAKFYDVCRAPPVTRRAAVRGVFDAVAGQLRARL
jgi:hypothetical protein